MGGIGWHGIGLNYTYSKILNDNRVKGRCKDIPLLTTNIILLCNAISIQYRMVNALIYIYIYIYIYI